MRASVEKHAKLIIQEAKKAEKQHLTS